VAAGVLGQVVAAHEAAVAHGAGELLLPGVSAFVTGELVRACKPLVTLFPEADEGFLTCMCSEVRFKV
jgi:hypothetical protein